MAMRKTFADYPELRERAMNILKTCGGDREIILAVQRLMNSRDDAVSFDEAVRQLKALTARCKPKAKNSGGVQPAV
jgi:hypothetical protein